MDTSDMKEKQKKNEERDFNWEVRGRSMTKARERRKMNSAKDA